MDYQNEMFCIKVVSKQKLKTTLSDWMSFSKKKTVTKKVLYFFMQYEITITDKLE